MENSGSMQNLKLNNKAKISLTLGIIGLIALIIIGFYPYNYPGGGIFLELGTKFESLLLLIIFFISIIGLVMGILGFKNRSKIIAISGIILGIINLVGVLLSFLAIGISST